VDTAAKPGVDGSKHIECTVCHTTLKTEIIPALPVVTEPEDTTTSQTETTTEPEDTTTSQPSTPSEPATDFNLDLSTLEGSIASWPEVGYTTPLIKLSYDQAIALGYMDLSGYAKVRIQYGCDGNPDKAGAKFSALGGNVPIGLKSTATSYGHAGNYVMTGDIAHTDMTFSTNAWAAGARWAEIDLSGINYAGDVYVAVHNPEGTIIAISAIEFIAATEDTTTEPEDTTQPSTPTEPVTGETMAASPSKSFPYVGYVDAVNGTQYNDVNGYRTGEAGNRQLVIAQIANQTATNGKLTLAGWALVNGGQDKYFWSVDGKNWTEVTDIALGATGEAHAASATGAFGLNAVVSANGLYNMTLDLSQYAGKTVTVYIAVRSTLVHDSVQHLCHFVTLSNVTVPAVASKPTDTSKLSGSGTSTDPYVLPGVGSYQANIPASGTVYFSFDAPSQGTLTLVQNNTDARFQIYSNLTGASAGPITVPGTLMLNAATSGDQIIIEVSSSAAEAKTISFTLSFESTGTSNPEDEYNPDDTGITNSSSLGGSGTQKSPYIITKNDTYLAELRQPTPAAFYRFTATKAGTFTFKMLTFATDGQAQFNYSDHNSSVWVVNAKSPTHTITLQAGQSIDFVVDQYCAEPGDITFVITFTAS
jgi:hypothetical protein